jgi:chitodextrinase
MKLIERRCALRRVCMKGRLLAGLIALTLLPVITIADQPIASSSFVGAENPLSENGTWVMLTAYSPYGTVFQKNNGAFPDRLSPLNHAGARTTALVPADHYSEVVVGHIENSSNNVGPIVRVQTSAVVSESLYLWWASLVNGGNFLYRLDARIPDPSRAITYTATPLTPTSPVVDGDRLRLIARGQVLYGIKNGVRDFIYNTATNTIKYAGGTTGIFAYADGAVTNANIASWSTGPAPVSSGTWASSTFAGTENPLDEGDRWYPLPGYSGFRKAAGTAIGLNSGQNVSGVWSIAPPAKQYSEVTLGAVASGGGGPIVRIDRNNPGQTGWLLFLYTDAPSSSGIYKLTPDGGFTAVLRFTPIIVSGDKWRLTADGDTLEVFRNGVFQFTYTTDGAYPAGDVGIMADTQAFTFEGWEGGDIALGSSPSAPSNLSAIAASSSQINLGWTASTDDVGVTGYLVERCQGSGCTDFAQVGTATGTTYNDTGLAAATGYRYRVRATDAAGNLSPYSNVASATTLAAPDTSPPTAPGTLTAVGVSDSQVDLVWTPATDNVGVTGYLVERCQGVACTAFAQIATVAGTTYSNTGLAANTSYSYRVRATDAAANLGPYSNVSSATTLPDTSPPTAPELLTAIAVSGSQIKLIWAASTDNVEVTGYVVERCHGDACTTFVEVATVTDTTYIDTALVASTAYSHRVRAIDKAGNRSPYSNVTKLTL